MDDSSQKGQSVLEVLALIVTLLSFMMLFLNFSNVSQNLLNQHQFSSR